MESGCTSAMAPILAIASTKGGVSKTTLALGLALHWAGQGRRVVALDTDPNASLTQWAGQSTGDAPHVLRVSDDDVVIEARDAARRADIVVIDVAGAGKNNTALLYAVGVSDAVLIPTKAGGLDLAQTLETSKIVKSAAMMTGRAIHSAAVLTQTAPRDAAAKHTRAQLDALGVAALSPAFPLRAAYKAATFGAFPMDDAAVREDVAAIVAAIEPTLFKGRGA